MTEKTKEEELKQKLLDFFDKKLTDFATKFQTDIDTIEKMKYEYFDSVIKKYEKIVEEHKKHEAEEKEKEKAEKKSEEAKHEKVPKKKIDPSARPKTPMASTKKPKLKEEKPHDKTEIHKDKKEVKPKAAGAGKAAGAKAPSSKKTEPAKRPVTSKGDTKAKPATKKGAPNSKKVDPKKGKKAPAKKDKKEEKKEEEQVKEVEEKKPVIVKAKYIMNIPDELKNNPGLSCIYSALKGKYIDDKKKVLHLTTHSPLLYKSFGSSLKFLLDEKKAEVQNKANEIEKFLNNYGDLNSYLTKEFSLSKKAINSIQFFKKKEEDEILKMADIPKEVGMILKCLYYIIDENFDENMGNKELFENMLNNILIRNEDNSFKSLLVNYCNQNKYLNLTKEKFDKLNNIINENNNILNMINMTKLSRPFSLFCFLIKEVHDYINLKTLDGQYYFDLRMKNNELQKYKDLLYVIENDGKPREPPKGEKKEEEAKVEEVTVSEVPVTGEEAQKVEKQKVDKVEEAPKTEETKIEEVAKVEVTTEEVAKVEEVPKTEEVTKLEEIITSKEGEQPPQA